MDHAFTEEDKLKVVKFLNLVAKHAEFKTNTQELIEYFKHLSYMQTGLLTKIEQNILEVKEVVESKLTEEGAE